MKNKLFIALFIFIAVVVVSYFYTFKSHRDISTETADYLVTIPNLEKEFIANDSIAYGKYQDKTIELSGKITSIESDSKGILIDEKVFATFKDSFPKNIYVGKNVKIKGRFLGYDELLEEFKIDQISIIQ